MPNWCNNTAEIYHTDPAMLERVREAFDKGALLEEFIPVPASLKIVAGSVGAKDSPEQIELEAAQKNNIEVNGYKDWYDFCVNEWGTKWDIGADGQPAQDIPGGLILSFDSAWAPPCAAYEKLVEMGFSIRATYYEPGMCFAGIWDNGHDDYYEYSNMSSEEVAETLPVELDEAYCISESMAEWEDENQEIDLDGGLSATNE
jgi:hypothetical protein